MRYDRTSYFVASHYLEVTAVFQESRLHFQDNDARLGRHFAAQMRGLGRRHTANETSLKGILMIAEAFVGTLPYPTSSKLQFLEILII
jgi:hypothetical protein